MERNPKALCSNCPYWAEGDPDPNTRIEIISAAWAKAQADIKESTP